MRGIGLATAFRTLTIIPFPGKESKSPATGLYWFVVIGLVLGLVSFGITIAFSYLHAPLVGGALAAASLVWLTRAFHIDGLADMADGFGGGRSKEQVLAVMKDSHIGSFGATVLFTVLAIKVAAIGALCERESLLVLYVPILSRFFLVLQAVANPYAREHGGTAAALVSQARWHHVLIALGEAAALCACALFIIREILCMAFIGLLSTIAISRISRRRIGGITGDVLGATVEAAEAAMLVAAVIVTG